MKRAGIFVVVAALSVSTSAALAFAPPVPARNLAPDSTYVLISADTFDKSVESWKKTGIYKLMESEQMKKVFGSEGAGGSMDKRIKELGAPEGSATWPDAFGVAFFTTHNAELDSEQPQILFYGDWGTRADAASQLFDAVIADTVKTEKWRTETGDEILGRKVTVLHLAADDQEMRERVGGSVAVEMNRTTESLLYARDGSRFFVSTNRAGLQDALEAVDGKRKSSVAESKDYQSALDLLGTQDISCVLLTGPMQKALPGTGMGPLSMMEPLMQTLLGDVKAWCVGVDVQGPRGQVEVTGTALMPGPKVGLWTLLGAGAPIENPPPMVGPEAISYSRINIAFKEIMPLLNTVAANLPPQATDMLDEWLINFGPAVTKAFEAMGPSVWMTSQIRQPISPESVVGNTIIACSNPKAVIPVIAQFGPQMSLQPRDVDGNTIFSSEGIPFALGVSNGYVSIGDSKQVEQAMRAVGQKDLPTVAENPAYKKASKSAGTEPLVGWGFIDVVARWGFDREMIKLALEDEAMIGQIVEEADDSPWAKRLGYDFPDNMLELLTALDTATLAKYVGPYVWSVKVGEKGLVGRLWVMPGTEE